MAAQSTTDIVFHWGTWNYGASMTDYTVVANGDVSAQVNHGEEMEKVSEAMSLLGTWMGVSAHSVGGTTLTITMENSGWADAAAVQVALRALGGNLATATVS